MKTPTPFQLQQQVKDGLVDAFSAGERYGERKARAERDMLAGAAFCIGFAIGVVVAVTFIGWFLP